MTGNSHFGQVPRPIPFLIAWTAISVILHINLPFFYMFYYILFLFYGIFSIELPLAIPATSRSSPGQAAHQHRRRAVLSLRSTDSRPINARLTHG